MRNLLLSLVLVNLLILAWQFWVDPSPPVALDKEGDGLALFAGRNAPAEASGPARPAPVPASGGGPALPPAGVCFRLGPLPDAAASQQAATSLAGRGIDATPIARDAQLWLGHWVQISGFDSVPAAEIARERLVAGGVADALLMQDGPQPLISLGVFRDRDRADRVANAARNLGFEVAMRDRYRPGVEQWLLVRPRNGQEIRPADLSLAGDRILRAERAPCDDAGGAAAPANAGPPAPEAGAPLPEVAEQPL
jgi:hypothetical protein